MPEFLIPGGQFIVLDVVAAVQVILLGFIGGILSGFIGSGGAFFMTPGMMNLGVPGAIAVASNITHKFGKAMIGQKRHGEMGHVDKKLAIFMLATAAVAAPRTVGLARWIHSMTIHPITAAEVAVLVLRKASPAVPSAASALPALNPNHPTQRRAAPITVRGRLWGGIGTLRCPLRGPR